MSKKKFNLIWAIAFLFIIIGIEYANYSQHMSVNTKIPSEKWSKDTTIEKGNIDVNTRIIEREGKIFVAYAAVDKIKIISLDNLGNKLSENQVQADNEYIDNLIFATNDKDYYIGWTTNIDGKNVAVNVELDKDFSVKKKTKIEEISGAQQLDRVSSVYYGDNKIVYNNYKTGINKEFSSDTKIHILAGSSSVKDNEKVAIGYIDMDGNFKYANLNSNGKTNGFKQIGVVPKTDKLKYTGMVMQYGDNIEILAENIMKDESKDPLAINFDEQGNKFKYNVLELRKVDSIYEISKDMSGKTANFIAAGDRYTLKEKKGDVFSFTIDKGIIRDEDFISRSRNRGNPSEVSLNNEYAIYAEYINDVKMLKLSSQKPDFKGKYNVSSREDEIEYSRQQTLTGMAMALSYIFIYAMAWLLPGIIIAGIFSFFEYKFNEKHRLIGFCVIYLLTAAIKCYFLNITMAYKYGPMLLGIFKNNGLAVLAVNVFISLVAMIYGFLFYKKDLDTMPIAVYAPAILADSVITLLIFIPMIS